MRNWISKAVVAGLAALAMSAAVISPTTPASAAQFHGGGFGGGFHGGGFHPGFAGFHPGFAGFRHGFRPGFVGFHRGRFFHPGFFAAGVAVGGIATYPFWGGYGNGCWYYRPIYDAWGDYLGQSYVSVCS
jgi:hypothetical protein